MNATTEKSKRPDTSDMIQFIWFTENELPLECYLYYSPGAENPMELMHVLVNGEYDIADILEYRACQDIEKMALLDVTRKERAELARKNFWISPPKRDYHSFASMLG